jgi:hypothetical protein
MTEDVASGEPRIVRSIGVLLLVVAAIRLVAAVVSGFVEWHDAAAPYFPSGRIESFDVLTTFGQAGDGTELLLVFAAAAALWWASRAGDPLAWRWRGAVDGAFVVTGVLAVGNAVGFWLIYSVGGEPQTGHAIGATGFSLATVIGAAGGIVFSRRLDAASDVQFDDDDGIDAFVFAVDRGTGDVRAFFSAGEAKRRMHVYSVEDDEFAFYTDEGVVLEASAEDDRITLRPTEQVHADELLTKLKQFTNRRGIAVDPEDLDDPTAFVVPIRRWHWLEMWPPWTRPIGMLFRRNG